MAITRGRPNKAAPKAKVFPQKKTAAEKHGAPSKVSKIAGIAKTAILGVTTPKATKKISMGKHKNARNLLKKAYEKRAKRQIRFGMLGQARKTLRKKVTVI